jgi:hypothetical protein
MNRSSNPRKTDIRAELERSIRNAEDLESLKRALLGILDLVVSDVEGNKGMIDALDARISQLHRGQQI